MRLCLWTVIGVIVTAPLVTGCPFAYSLAVLQGNVNAERRIAETPCGDSACRRGAWRVTRVSLDTVYSNGPR